MISRTAPPTPGSPVRLVAEDRPDQPAVTPGLQALYRDLEQALMIPLWTEIGQLMPSAPASAAAPHRWQWSTVLDLAARSGDLVPVGRGGERRAIALANPGLGGRPFATPTLWAAVQYLLPGEDAPEHRHTQHAFRFVVEGSGVWTVVNRDPVRMSRGDFLPQAGMNWHAHTNASSVPMAWIDGLDIPFQHAIESQFFEPGRDALTDDEHLTPATSRSERVWGHPALAPVGAARRSADNPLLCYRWADTDAALHDQLALDAEGHPVVDERGHAIVRFIHPATGDDALPTVRAQFHRIATGVETAPRRDTGSSVYQVFDGAGRVTVGDVTWSVTRGDLFVVPSWVRWSARSEASPSDSDSGALDLFQFSDAPIFEKLGLHRTEVEAS